MQFRELVIGFTPLRKLNLEIVELNGLAAELSPNTAQSTATAGPPSAWMSSQLSNVIRFWAHVVQLSEPVLLS